MVWMLFQISKYWTMQSFWYTEQELEHDDDDDDDDDDNNNSIQFVFIYMPT
jgi:hypothetical protein